jgi:hypothetical protein
MNIRDKISLPSQALQAMVDGLHKVDKSKRYQVRMEYFIEERGELCTVCAATCAVLNLYGIPRKRFESFSQLDNTEEIGEFFEGSDIVGFEYALEDARRGDLLNLFIFFEKKVDLELRHGSWDLQTDNWREQLPEVEKAIKVLQQYGL